MTEKYLTDLQSLVYHSSGVHLIVWREIATRAEIHAMKGIADERVFKNLMKKRGREEATKLLAEEIADRYAGEPVVISTEGEFEEEAPHGREIVYRFQISIQRLSSLVRDINKEREPKIEVDIDKGIVSFGEETNFRKR